MPGIKSLRPNCKNADQVKSDYMRKIWAVTLPVLLCALFLAQETKDSESLRHYADKMGFWVGSVIQGKFFRQDPPYQSVLGREFNLGISIVLMRHTQPERGRFEYSGMDRDREFAQAHHMKLFGQALVYRNDQSPDWLRFQIGHCGGWSARDLDANSQRAY